MKRMLLLGVLATAVLVPVPLAAAAPAATHTLRGTVVAKDRADRALVVALPGGTVQTVVAPAAFRRTDIGRRVVIRYTGITGGLPIALGVSLKGHARSTVVRGTLVRVVKRHAILNAGASMLNVTLKAPKGQRALASAKDAPKAGDSVRVEIDIDDDGSLDASAVVVAAALTGPTAGSEGEMEVRGKVKDPLSAGSITVTTGTGFDVTCVIPPNVTLNVKVGAPIELKCDFIGGVWTVRVAHGEGEHSGSSGKDSSKVEVRGTIKELIDTAVTVTPRQGDPVVCTIPAGVSLAQFAVDDFVKMECVKTSGSTALTLKEIEKKGSDSSAGKSGGHDHHGDNGDHEDDDDEGED